MKNKHIISFLMLASGCFLLTGCDDFLNETPKGAKIPTTIEDYRAFLGFQISSGESTDRRYISNEFHEKTLSTSNAWNATNYNWLGNGAKRVGEYTTDAIYKGLYTGLYRYNLVINEVPKVVTHTAAEAKEAKQLVAQARTIRAFYYFVLINTYAKAYNPATAATDPGVLYTDYHADFERTLPQLTVAQIYDKMLEDLQAAIPDLPTMAERYDALRVSDAMAYALRARIHLFMHKYDEALADASKALSLHNVIWDQVDFYQQWLATLKDGTTPITDPQHFSRNLFTSRGSISYVDPKRAEYYLGAIAQNSYGKYLAPEGDPADENYVRDKSMFDDGDVRFLANFWYDVNNGGYYRCMAYWDFVDGGLKTSEMYLIRAEVYARKGEYQKAMDELNVVRKKRILPEKYRDLTASNLAEARYRIKRERQVELMFSDMLFYDLRRWNTDPAWAVTIKKVDKDGNVYTITPDSPIWVLPFANDVVIKNPGIKQNTTI